MSWSEDDVRTLLQRGHVRIVGHGEQDLEAYVRRGQPAPLTERAWQTAVVRLLRQHNYTYIYHTWNSRRSPSGFPDLVAVHREPGQVCYAIECKTDAGQVTLAQWHWLEALGNSRNVIAEVWRPQDLESICARLRG